MSYFLNCILYIFNISVMKQNLVYNKDVDRLTNIPDLTNCNTGIYDMDSVHKIGKIMMNLKKRNDTKINSQSLY